MFMCAACPIYSTGSAVGKTKFVVGASSAKSEQVTLNGPISAALIFLFPFYRFHVLRRADFSLTIERFFAYYRGTF
jgi:hypothetical protein